MNATLNFGNATDSKKTLVTSVLIFVSTFAFFSGAKLAVALRSNHKANQRAEKVAVEDLLHVQQSAAKALAAQTEALQRIEESVAELLLFETTRAEKESKAASHSKKEPEVIHLRTPPPPFELEAGSSCRSGRCPTR